MSQAAERKTESEHHMMQQCGAEFANPIPAGREMDSDTETFDKNHWKIVFEAHREQDKRQCEIWKDEVNTLLIFAGLFSAVVTAFLIESYKFLLPEDGSGSSKFAPNAPHVIRLNSLWFCSLVLALSTAVIGIVALQWIRNHERYHGIAPRDALSVLEMRTKALHAWHIRWAFLGLPLLILVALVLFFVGLVDFLLSLNKKVVVPVSVLVYITLALLFVTTALPSCQIIWLSIWPPTVVSEDNVPNPCPYKSAQSLLLHRFLCRVFGIPRFLREKVFCWEAPADRDLLLRDLPLFCMFYPSPNKWTDFDTKWLRLRDMYSQMMGVNRKEGSTQKRPIYHLMWLLLRNMYSKVIELNRKETLSFRASSVEHPRRPIYDEGQILIQTITGEILSPGADVIFAAYHCFEEVSKNALFEGQERTEDNDAPKYDERNRILRGYYWKHLTSPTTSKGEARSPFGAPISDLVENPSTHLLHDENMSVFLGMHSPHGLTGAASRVISAHLSELHGRILAYFYASQPPLRKKIEDSSKDKDRWLLMMPRQYIKMLHSARTLPRFKIWSHFAPQTLNGTDVSVSPDTIDKSIIQLSMIFERFVDHVADLVDEDWDFRTTAYADRDVAQFIQAIATMVRYTSGTDASSWVETAFDRLRHTLSGTLPTTNADGDPAKDEKGISQTNGDYLFLMSCYLTELVFNPYDALPVKPFNHSQCKGAARFIEALNTYEQANGAVDRIKKNYQALWSNVTDFPKAPRHAYREEKEKGAGHDSDKPTVIEKKSYIRWKYIPKAVLDEIHLPERPA